MIRISQKEDRESLKNLVMFMLGNENKEEIATFVVDDFYQNTQFNVYVYEQNDEVVGFGALKNEAFEGANGVSEIVWLGIHPNHKRNGYGKKLVQFIEHVAKKNGIRKIYIKTGSNNKSAVCFWIQMDYTFEARLLDFGMESHDDYFLGKNI